MLRMLQYHFIFIYLNSWLLIYIIYRRTEARRFVPFHLNIFVHTSEIFETYSGYSRKLMITKFSLNFEFISQELLIIRSINSRTIYDSSDSCYPGLSLNCIFVYFFHMSVTSGNILNFHLYSRQKEL